MIVVNLLGGLGNQMFQYAFGKALSARQRFEVTFDTSDFAWYSRHGHPQLSTFPISLDIAREEVLRDLLGWQHHRFARRLRLYKRVPKPRTVVEPHYTFARECYEGADGRYFVGYWQSERYFADYSEQIRAQLSPQRIDVSMYGAFVNEIDNSNSVAVHVRRGDYQSNWLASRTMSLCAPSYYRAGIEHICGLVKLPKFFVFSDDHSAVERENLIPMPHVAIRTPSSANAVHELALMSRCKHFVIANSTFSWWAAWLSSHPGKIVVRPTRWFKSASSTADLLPSSWVAVE